MQPPHKVTIRKLLRRFSRYFFEFIMLFLAVSLGFFVENQRDAMSERQEELRLMKALLSDLRADTARINRIIALRLERNELQDSLNALLFSQDRAKHVSEINTLTLAAGGKGTMFYKSNTMNFLATEGFYKITSEAVSNAAREYHVKIEDLLAAQEGAIAISQGFRNVAYRLLDSKTMSARGQTSLKLFSTDPDLLNEISNRLGHITNNNLAQVRFAEQLRAQAEILMKAIQQDYPLSED